MNKDKIDFFVLKGTEQEQDIKDIVNCLDKNKGEYRINYITKNGVNTSVLRVIFTTGECAEYEENEMFKIILNYVKLGMKLPSK